jgi:CRISPR-associated endonuclease/helicase Cas3
LLQYNWRAVKGGNQPGIKYYNRPGFEDKVVLDTHDLCELIDTEMVSKNVNAIPRIQKPTQLNYRKSLSDLEHKATKDLLANYLGVGPEELQGYLAGNWYLTALPQALNPFRKSEPTTKVFFMYNPDNGECVFVEKDDQGHPIIRENIFQIHRQDIDKDHKNKLWLYRNYEELIEQYAEQEDRNKKSISLSYGELSFVYRENHEYEYSDQFGLVKI